MYVMIRMITRISSQGLIVMEMASTIYRRQMSVTPAIAQGEHLMGCNWLKIAGVKVFTRVQLSGLEKRNGVQDVMMTSLQTVKLMVRVWMPLM